MQGQQKEQKKEHNLRKLSILFNHEDKERNLRAVSEVVNEVTVRKIRGYALVFDMEGTPWLGSVWKEKINSNALAQTKLDKTYFLLNHDTNWVLGKAGKNMTLTVDKIGLFVEITLGNTSIDDYVFDRVEKELLDGMSFWFDSKTIIATDWENKIDSILQINEIYEVSLLPFPAYQQTVVIAETQGEQRSETDPKEGTPEDEPKQDELLAMLELEMEL